MLCAWLPNAQDNSNSMPNVPPHSGPGIGFFRKDVVGAGDDGVFGFVVTTIGRMGLNRASNNCNPDNISWNFPHDSSIIWCSNFWATSLEHSITFMVSSRKNNSAFFLSFEFAYRISTIGILLLVVLVFWSCFFLLSIISIVCCCFLTRP